MDLPSPTSVEGMFWYLLGSIVLLAVLFGLLFGALYLDLLGL